MSEWKIRFGTAGTSDSFTAMGYKNSLDIPAYTEKMGLDAFEYQCGHGISIIVTKRQFKTDYRQVISLLVIFALYWVLISFQI